MADIILIERQPTYNMRPSGEGGRFTGSCSHFRLKMDMKNKTVECRGCGVIWKDWTAKPKKVKQ